ncbi:MAG: hypothetical protein EPN47_13565 [Acidobacteria bacterium]|nr:MAG: hypothetical protein EPN47_13565 [Acidobacteriota bacterium]
MSLKNLLNRFTGRRNDPWIHRPEDHPESGVEGVPDFVEPLLGWRAWRIWAPAFGSNLCPAFSSVILDTPWMPRGKFSAEHSFDLGAKCRGLLDLDCSCGIYAFKSPLGAFDYLMRVRDRLLGRSVEVALGTVSLWGKVIECELGYKAQYAYPEHIYLPASFVRFLPEVTSAFGVAVGIYASACEEEISLPVSSATRDQHFPRLRLKSSVFLNAHHFPYEIGFYDVLPSPAQGKQLPIARPDFSSPPSGLPEEPGDTCWS